MVTPPTSGACNETTPTIHSGLKLSRRQKINSLASVVVCVTVTVPVETAAAGSCDEETGEGRGGAKTAFGNCCSVNWGTVVAVTTPLGIVAGKGPTKRKQFYNHLKSPS